MQGNFRKSLREWRVFRKIGPEGVDVGGIDLEGLGAEGQEVVEGGRLVGRVAQEGGRMVGAHEVDALAQNELAMLPGDAEIRVDEALRRHAAKTDDDLRADKADLLAEPADADVLLIGTRVPVLGRPAFHHVGYIDIDIPIQINCRQHLIQQLAGRAHKRLPLQVLLLAGALAHEHDICVGVAGSKYQVCAVRRQTALLTAHAGLFESFHVFKH